jgi:outer membrane assembly lipoprotein YfiO
MKILRILPFLLLLTVSAFAQDIFPGGDRGAPPDRREGNEPTDFHKSETKWNKVPAETNMKKADDLFARHKWNRAAQRYQQVTFERNSPLVPRAQFQIAECYFNLKRYAEACTEYEVVTRQYPDQPNIDKAYFQIGVCYFEDSLGPEYTQEETLMAINAFNDYLERFPNRNPDDLTKANEYIQKCEYKLLEKKYLTGYIYFKMSDYSSALMYFEEVRAAGLTDKVDLKSLYYTGKIYLKRHDIANARPVIETLASRYPRSSEAKRLEKKLPRD